MIYKATSLDVDFPQFVIIKCDDLSVSVTPECHCLWLMCDEIAVIVFFVVKIFKGLPVLAVAAAVNNSGTRDMQGRLRELVLVEDFMWGLVFSYHGFIFSFFYLGWISDCISLR